MLTYQPCPQTAVRLHDAQQNDDERRGLWRDKAFSWRLRRADESEHQHYYHGTWHGKL